MFDARRQAVLTVFVVLAALLAPSVARAPAASAQVAGDDVPAPGAPAPAPEDTVPVPASEPGPSSWDTVVPAPGEVLGTPAAELGAPSSASEPLPGGDLTRLQVKFVESAGIVRTDEGLDDGIESSDLDQLLSTPGVEVAPLFDRPVLQLEADRAEAEAVSGEAMPDLSSWFLVEAPDVAAGEQLAAALTALPEVEMVQPESELAVTQPSEEILQGYLNAGSSGVDAEWAWTQSGGSGANVTVAVIDSGFDTSHPDLDRASAAGVPIPHEAARNVYHGTQVLGILVADDDGAGMRGIVHDAGIRTVNSGTTSGDVANAIDLASTALGPGDVITISQGIVCSGAGCSAGVVLPLVYSSAARDALRVASGRGVITVVSGGNGGANLDNFASRLGSDAPDTIVVGAANPPATSGCTAEDGPSRSRVSSSNYGSRVDLQGWGACTRTTGLNNTYLWWGFTSAATPVVAGSAASLSSMAEASRGITLTSDQVRRLFQRTGSSQVTSGTRGGNIGPLPDLEDAMANLWLIPGNDMWASARNIDRFPYQSTLITEWAGVEVGEPAPLCGSIGHTAWYRYTPSSDITVTFDTVGSDYDTLLALWARSGNSLSRVACDNDISDSQRQSRIVRTLEAGTTYYVQVGGRNGAEGNMVFNATAGGIVDRGCDVDGDGRADLVTGAPDEGIGSADGAGRALVYFGSSSGIPSRVTSVDQESNGVPGRSEADDGFGTAVTCGDFDGDGRDDLAVGVPGEDIDGRDDVGFVHVLEGRSGGISRAGSLGFGQNTAGVAGTEEAGDRFGAALAAGDFNGDGYDDLAVGIPGEDLGGRADTGAVQVFYGSSSGLVPANDRFIDQNTLGVPGTNESGDQFGTVLAAADVTGDGYEDLVVGAPLENVGDRTDAGAMWMLPGGFLGITGAAGRSLHQDSTGVAGTAEPGDHFGAALATVDIDGDGRAEIIVGAPGEGVEGRRDAGLLHVFKGRAALSGSGSSHFHQNVAGVRGTAERDDFFGAALAGGDVDGDGHGDVVVGVPGEAVGSVNGAGLVQVLFGSSSGLSTSSDRLFEQQRDGIGGTPETGDGFGAAVAAVDLDGDGRHEVVVGVPAEDLGSVIDAGYLLVIPGSASGPLPAASRSVDQERPASGSSEPGDRLGQVLSAG